MSMSSAPPLPFVLLASFLAALLVLLLPVLVAMLKVEKK
jgi:hypothetical protein